MDDLEYGFYADLERLAVTFYQGELRANFHHDLRIAGMRADYILCVTREQRFVVEFYIAS